MAARDRGCGMKRLIFSLVLVGVPLALALRGSPASGRNGLGGKLECADNAVACTEVAQSIGYQGQYTGHDEPSVLFYSNRAGAGNAMTYQLTLPRDPATPPTQDGR